MEFFYEEDLKQEQIRTEIDLPSYKTDQKSHLNRALLVGALYYEDFDDDRDFPSIIPEDLRALKHAFSRLTDKKISVHPELTTSVINQIAGNDLPCRPPKEDTYVHGRNFLDSRINTETDILITCGIPWIDGVDVSTTLSTRSRADIFNVKSQKEHTIFKNWAEAAIASNAKVIYASNNDLPGCICNLDFISEDYGLLLESDFVISREFAQELNLEDECIFDLQGYLNAQDSIPNADIFKRYKSYFERSSFYQNYGISYFEFIR